MRRIVWLAVLWVWACTPDAPPANAPDGTEQPLGFEAPVATNPEPPFSYPTSLYDQGVEGSVVLRLFVDSTGFVVPESTSIAEGSGYAAFDSAALGGATTLQFAPARRDGTPVSTIFLQPVHFRLPDGSAPGGAP
jgi:periplasmic protein TonB